MEENQKKRKRDKEQKKGDKKKDKTDRKKDKKHKKDKKDQKDKTHKSEEKPVISGSEQNLPDSSTIQDFRKKNNITIHSTVDYSPVFDFARVDVHQDLKSFLSKFDKPTPIQSECWPLAISGKDMIGIAQTGSGKIGSRIGFKSLVIYGGVPKHVQKQEIKEGWHCIVATPGRLLDLVDEGAINLSEISFLVLDEADRMLDMGFEKDIRRIVSLIPKKRQTLMFSATWPNSIRELAAEFLSNPSRITIGSDTLSASQNVTQIVQVVKEPNDRDQILTSLLSKYHSSRKNRVIIFALYKKEAARLEFALQKKGWNVQAIHGDKDQTSRNRVLENFKSGKCPLMIATDVAARGLDIPNVEYVINFTFPLTIEDYVHRIGRTGRAGNTGLAHTLFTPFDKAHAGELVNVLKSTGQKVPEDLMSFGTTVKKKEHKEYGAFYKEIDPNAKSSHVKFDSDEE